MSDQPSNPMRDAIQEAIGENPVILFMKGNPDAPACGFSARTVAILQSMGARFAAVDILPDPRIRQELSAISNWPTPYRSGWRPGRCGSTPTEWGPWTIWLPWGAGVSPAWASSSASKGWPP